MFSVPKIIPNKIVKARGERTRREVVIQGQRKFTEQDLYNWEKGENLPPVDKQPYLLLGLGVPLAEISEEISAKVGV